MVVLDEQGKHLRNAVKDLDEIKKNMKTAESNLNVQMLWLVSVSINQSTKNDQKYKQVWDRERREADVVSSQVTAIHNTQEVSARSEASSGPFIKNITNDTQEKKVEQNLGQVAIFVGNLKNMAIDMGNELDQQNKILDIIENKIEKSTNNVQSVTKKAKNYLRSRKDGL